MLEELHTINQTNHLGDTPMHNAARDGHLEVVKCFLAINPDNPENSYGITPLHKAAIKGHFDIFQEIFKAIGRQLPENFWRTTSITYTEEFRRKLEIIMTNE